VRSFRLLAIILMVAGYAAAPVVGQWVSTANASTVTSTSRAETAMAPAYQDNGNDNQYEDCGTGNPRKDKKCHYNTPNTDIDNDNAYDDGDGPGPGGAPVTTLEVNTADPQRGQTLRIVAVAKGSDMDQIWWWVTDYSTRDAPFLTNNLAYYAGCDGTSYCQQYVEITAGNEGTFVFHAKSRDRQGRESNESAVQIRVH
jgi:hypothetical protein